MIYIVIAIIVVSLIVVGIILAIKNKNKSSIPSFTIDNAGIVDGIITSSGAIHDSFSVNYSYSYKVDGIEYTNKEWVNKRRYIDAYDVDLMCVNFNLAKYQPIKVIYNKDNPQESHIYINDEEIAKKKKQYNGW